jgi:hypothetical protein
MIKEIITSPKIASTVSAAATGSGIGQYLEIIPSSDIIKISTILGAILSVVLIYNHIKKRIHDSKMEKMNAEMRSFEFEVMKKKEFERLEDSKRMHRRKDDAKD